MQAHLQGRFGAHFLSGNRRLRFLCFTLFYVAQGLPIGLISIALPAWLAEQGAGVGDIATFLAISGLPWGFKLLAGPVMDRFSYLAMGRRRPWVIAAQGGMLLSIVALGAVPDPVSQLGAMTWLAFAVNCCGAVQDVAVDGMAIDLLPPDERGRANAFMAFGQVAGYSASGALCALALSSFGLAAAGWILAAGMGVVLAAAVAVRERDGERLLPWTRGRASAQAEAVQFHDWSGIFRHLVTVMFLPASLLLLAMTLFWRANAGIWLTAAPVIAVGELGYTSNDYSYWSAITGFVAAVFGLLVGPLIDRYGARRFMLASMLMMAMLYFIVAATTSLWSAGWFVLLVLFVDALVGQIVFIAFIALHMNICWARISATQFAIYMAWANLSRSIGAWVYGELQPWFAVGDEFVIMGASMLVAALLLRCVDFRAHASRLHDLDH